MSETEGYIAADIIEGIEDAIRYKLKTQDDYSPEVMAEAIMSIPQNVNAVLKEKDILTNGSYESMNDYADGYSKVNVNVKTEESGGKILPVLKNLSVTSNGSYDASDDNADGYALVNVNIPGGGSSVNLTDGTFLENGIFTPPSGYDGFNSVNVQVYSDEVSIGPKNTTITENGIYRSQTTDNKDGYSEVNVQIPLENAKTVTENGTVLPSSNYAGMKEVNVAVPLQEEKTASKNGTVYPDNGYTAIKKVVVDVPTSGGVVGPKNVTANGTYNAEDEGLDGYNTVSVAVPQPELEEKSVNLTSTSSIDINPTSGVYGMSKVTVTPILQEKSVTSNGDVYPDSGYSGLSKVNVSVSSEPLTTRTITTNGVYGPLPGYSGYSQVNVQVPCATTTQTFTTNGVYSAPYGYVGFSQVNVQVPQPTYNSGTIEISSDGEYFASTYGYDGFSSVNVNTSSTSVGDNQLIYKKNSDAGQKYYAYPTDYRFFYEMNTSQYDYMIYSQGVKNTIYVGDKFRDYTKLFSNKTVSNKPYVSNFDLNVIINHYCSDLGFRFKTYEKMFYNCINFGTYGKITCYDTSSSVSYMIDGMYAYQPNSTKEMFYNCQRFNQNVHISWPGSSDVAYKQTENKLLDMSYMFYNCTNFNSIVNSMDNEYHYYGNRAFMFYNCQNFNPDIANLPRTEREWIDKIICSPNVKRYYGSSSSYINFYNPNWDINTSYMFAECKNMDPPIKFIYESGSDYFYNDSSYMFLNCINLTGNFNISSSGSKNIFISSYNYSGMFYGCSSLDFNFGQIDFLYFTNNMSILWNDSNKPDYYTNDDGFRSFDYNFYKRIIPADYMFSNCINLNNPINLNVGYYVYASFERMFNNCQKYGNVDGGTKNTMYINMNSYSTIVSMNNMFFNAPLINLDAIKFYMNNFTTIENCRNMFGSKTGPNNIYFYVNNASSVNLNLYHMFNSKPTGSRRINIFTNNTTMVDRIKDSMSDITFTSYTESGRTAYKNTSKNVYIIFGS